MTWPYTNFILTISSHRAFFWNRSKMNTPRPAMSIVSYTIYSYPAVSIYAFIANPIPATLSFSDISPKLIIFHYGIIAVCPDDGTIILAADSQPVQILAFLPLKAFSFLIYGIDFHLGLTMRPQRVL